MVQARERRFLISILIFVLLLLNIFYIKSPYFGLILFLLYLVHLGSWAGSFFKLKTTLNVILGVFLVISWLIVGEGMLLFLKMLSLNWMVFVLGLTPFFLYLFDVFRLSEHARSDTNNMTPTQHFQLRLFASYHHLRARRFDCLALGVFLLSLGVSFLIVLLARTGSGIQHVWEAISPIFWITFPVSLLSLLYILQRKTIDSKVKILFSSAFAFLIFGLNFMVYKHGYGADPLTYVGTMKRVFEIGGYALKTYVLAKVGYFALGVTVARSSAMTIHHLSWIHRLIIPFLASVYIPFFTYQIMCSLTKENPTFISVISSIFSPLLCFISLPLSKSLAFVFLLSTLYFSIQLFRRESRTAKDLIQMILVALATVLLDPTVGAFSLMAVFLALSIHFTSAKRGKIGICFIATCFALTIFFLPLSFIFGPKIFDLTGVYFVVAEPAYFSSVSWRSTLDFWLPSIRFPAEYTLDRIPYIYSENFTWIRYLIFASGTYLLCRYSSSFKKDKEKIWLVLTILAFWLTWFVLKVGMENTPVPIKDHRFGRLLDTSLIPFMGVLLTGIQKMKRVNLVFSMRFKNAGVRIYFRKMWLLVPALLIMGACLSVYAGYEYDRLVGRREEYARRMVVTDARMELMEYIRNTTSEHNYVIVSDNFMAKIAHGTLGLRPHYYGAELVHLNSGGHLYLYFYSMMRNPNTFAMLEAMRKTNSSIGFYVIGLEDWKGWRPEDSWIKRENLEKIKILSDEWKVFGEDLYLFRFEDPFVRYRRILEENWNELNPSRWSVEYGNWNFSDLDGDGDYELVSVGGVLTSGTWNKILLKNREETDFFVSITLYCGSNESVRKVAGLIIRDPTPNLYMADNGTKIFLTDNDENPGFDHLSFMDMDNGLVDTGNNLGLGGNYNVCRIGVEAKGKLVQVFVDVNLDGVWDVSAVIVSESVESGSISIMTSLSNMAFDDFELAMHKK